jgi:hypothetical protein
MESFSATYYADNPALFDPPLGKGGVDSVYVLAYSLIFLNTLNHNPSVLPERKLTKEMFRKQNLYSNPGFPVCKLDDIYARIMKQEFKTDTQYVEKIYERIRAFNHEETTKDTIKRSANVLQAGEHFLKFGRMGKPHMRFVYVSDDEESIFWCELKEEATRKEQPSFFFGGSKIKCIRCEDIIDIKVGYNASSVLKRHQLPIEFDDLIFSICTKTRTLDLQAKSSDIRNRWVKFLKLIHNELELKAKLKEEVDVEEEKQK